MVTCVVCETVMEWSEESREWICPECGNRAFEDKEGHIYYEHDL